MKALFDTSVLVAGLLETHSKHERAQPLLAAVKAGDIDGIVSSPSLAELYSTLTGMPIRPRVSPSQARAQIEANILESFTMIALDASDYLEVIEDLEKLELAGGVIYDALHGKAAEKAGADVLLTFNRRDFDRFGLKLEVREP